MNLTHIELKSRPFLRAAALALLMSPSPTIAPAADRSPADEARSPETAADPFEATWDSLKKHENPEWFRDAKFGIYTHWGPVTVASEQAPCEAEWYGNQMYRPDHPAFAYHLKRFGDQKTVGYKDVIPLFKAEKFDAAEWAELFAAAGAKFAGPVAVHHDNFANWDSAVTRWNSKAMGPKRDITGELGPALRARGLKFITTFHHGFAWRYYEPAYGYDAADPRFADLYGTPHAPGTPPTRQFQDTWLAMVQEVMVKYQPDLIWFDFELGSVIAPEYQQRMFADVYNRAARSGREIGVAHKHREIHEHTGILDFERGLEDRLTEYPWLTDTSVGPWFHHRDAAYVSADALVDMLVDIVSKNGCMLLNVGPKSDGTFTAEAATLLRDIGAWLKVNGEAIYGTRPWRIFGEGATRVGGGAFSEHTGKFTGKDIRFTRSKDGKTVHAIWLDWPGSEAVVSSFQVHGDAREAKAELLGHGPVPFKVDGRSRLVVQFPERGRAPDCRHACAVKLTGFDLSLHPDARFVQAGAVTLTPGTATLEGEKLRTQVNEGRPNIGAWDIATEKVHWLVRIARPGEHLLRAEVSCAYAPSGLKVTAAGQETTSDVPKTDGWFKPVFVEFGKLRFENPGVYHLVLEPTHPGQWKAVNVYQVQIAPLAD